MDYEPLIQLVAQRAASIETRTTCRRWNSSVGERATRGQIDSAEEGLGFPLYPFHRVLLQEVGNGGYGPGFGLIGVEGGVLTADDQTMVELAERILSGSPEEEYLVPLCDWGDGAWSCVHAVSGEVYTLVERGPPRTRFTLESMMAEWAAGISLVEELFSFEQRVGIDPFTKSQIVVTVRGRPKGV